MPGRGRRRTFGRSHCQIVSTIGELEPWRPESNRQLWLLHSGESPIRFATRTSQLPAVGATIRVRDQDYRVLSVEPGSLLDGRSAVVRVAAVGE
jgi:hypothetical protein